MWRRWISQRNGISARWILILARWIHNGSLTRMSSAAFDDILTTLIKLWFSMWIQQVKIENQNLSADDAEMQDLQPTLVLLARLPDEVKGNFVSVGNLLLPLGLKLNCGTRERRSVAHSFWAFKQNTQNGFFLLQQIFCHLWPLSAGLWSSHCGEMILGQTILLRDRGSHT